MTLMIVVAIAVGLIALGSHAAREIEIGFAPRILLGTTFLISGIALIYPLAGNGFEAHPVRYCFALIMVGLGVNQTLAPLIAYFRRSA